MKMPARMLSVWSTDALPPSDRFALWTDVTARMFIGAKCDAPGHEAFAGTIRHGGIGRIGIAEVDADPQRIERSGAMICRAPCEDLLLVMQIYGDTSVCSATGDGLMQPGACVVLDANEPYGAECLSRSRKVILKLPRHVLSDGGNGRKAPPRLPDLFLRAAPGSILRQLALCALNEAALLSTVEEGAVERAMLEIICSALEPADDIAGLRPALYQRYHQALSFIDANLGEPNLDVASIAAELGLSLRSITRLFAVHGTTPERAIWTRRLEATKRDFADPRLGGASITEIAFARGFSDAAHFSRRFRKAYGLPPSQFRRDATRGR